MQLICFCATCENEIRVKAEASTRPDLQMKRGDYLEITCNLCNRSSKVHVNDIKAQPRLRWILIGLAIGGLFTLFLWFFYGAIATVSFLLPLIFWQQEEKAVHAFNSYKIRRKII